LVNAIADDSQLLTFNHVAFDRRRYISELLFLQQQAGAIVSKEFIAKKPFGQLSFLLSPITGDVSVSILYYWKTNTKNNEQVGQYEFAFLPQDKIIQRSERLPFENLGIHAGEYFVQKELQTGFAVNLETSINSAFLGNSFKCRNRLLKKEVQMPKVTKGKVDSFQFLQSQQELMSFENYLNPYMEIIYETLLHKTPYQKSVPQLHKMLKSTQFAQILKKSQSHNNDKQAWVLEQIKKFLERSNPEQLAQADLRQTTELLTHFEGILIALLD
jgi:hypothetical protein